MMMCYTLFMEVKTHSEVPPMEMCERCDKLFSLREDGGDYVYRKSEQDRVAHPYCNNCLMSMGA